MMFRASEAAKIEQPFIGTGKGYAHSIEEIDDRRRHLAHRFGGRLIGKEVTAINRVIEMLPNRVAFTFSIHGSVNATLRAHRVRAFHRDDGKEINFMSGFGNF